MEYLREKIEELEAEINKKGYNDYLSEEDAAKVRVLEADIDKVLEELKLYDYFYIEATITGKNFKSYLDRKRWIRRTPRPFLTLEEAEKTIKETEEKEIAAYSHPLYIYKIYKHAAETVDSSLGNN